MWLAKRAPAARAARLTLRTRRLVEATLSSVLVLSRVPQPFSWVCALALGAAVAGTQTDRLRSASLALIACALAFVFSCAWVRFALPFIYRTNGARHAASRTGAGATDVSAARGGVSALPHLPDDVALLILARLRLDDVKAFGRCSRRTRALSLAPSLWRRIVVPDQAASVSAAVGAIPRCFEGPCTVAIRAGVYVEGQRSRLHRLLGMDCGLRTGIRITRPVVLEPFTDGDEVVIESDAGEAIAILPGAEAAVVRGLTVRTISFASHALAVYADGVLVERCVLRASGRNSCGVVVTGSGVRAHISRCAISGCGGGGVLLAYGVGPVCVSDTLITENGWSGIGAFSGASVVISRCDIRANKMFAIGVARDVSVSLREQPPMDGNELGGLHRYLAPPLHPQVSMQSR
ncbi:hypothetical protein KFE25_001856 [Diacronema lutheri]|uniref:F-box domain-containing protein n=1 Tax=Diacronema lutheri TaxID=2081491 RepID=A0A8J5XAS9_DIALT|nr:hypothetical protein KFE25_001856 [Diacronema lutheri]